MKAFTIKDLENLSGIKAHTIRIWEQRYSFLKPQRTSTNIRYYSNQELKIILNISLLNKFGYKISHIARMTDTEIREKILALTNVEAQQERIVNDLIHAMVDLRLEEFEQILDNYILVRGIEKTITHIIFPFLVRIGILWLTSHVNAAQEHIVTNIIRQKMIVGIETSVSHVKVNKSVLLFLPESEFHELGLLFTHYLLKCRGVSVFYLGASVPLDDIEYMVKMKKPDYVYSHLTAVSHSFNMEKFLQQLVKKVDQAGIVISGPVTRSYDRKVPPRVFFKRSVQELIEFISALQ
jgi:DNA-binding transcriptional MerR regulator